MLGAAHKPGAMPLRPLGDSATFTTPGSGSSGSTRGPPSARPYSSPLPRWRSPSLVTAILAVPDLSLDRPSGATCADAAELIGSFGSLALGGLLQSIGLVLVTGMIAHVTAAAAIGGRLSPAEAWGATHGRRWRLVGLTVLLGLMMLGLLAVYALIWVSVVLLCGPGAIWSRDASRSRRSRPCCSGSGSGSTTCRCPR